MKNNNIHQCELHPRGIQKLVILTIVIWLCFIPQNVKAAPLPSQVEYDALIAFYNATGGVNWTNKTGWSSANPSVVQDVSGWHGISVDGNGHVTTIFLPVNHLVGTIPASIGDLTYLTNLNLTANQISGGIPNEIQSLVNLKILSLQSNQVTSIPSTIGDLSALENCNFANNQLSTLPVEVGNLLNLRYLSLSNNHITGNIPSTLLNLSQLRVLDLSGNSFSGTIPSTIGELTNLTDLYLAVNLLTGSIPTSIGDLIHLEQINLGGNQLTGTIPTTIGNLPSLRYLQLQQNQLTGSIPDEIGQLDSLHSIVLSENMLSGSIPTSFGNLDMLYFVDLTNNQLTGSFPASSENYPSLSSLSIYGNKLSGPIPRMSYLDYLNINNNKFTHSEILPAKQAFRGSSMLYTQQDSVDVAKTVYFAPGATIKLESSIDRNTNPASIYQWYSEFGVPLNEPSASGHTVVMSNSHLSNDGTRYFYWISNPELPTMSLRSRFVTVRLQVSPAPPPSQVEYDALIAFYNSTSGASWSNNTGWSSANPNVPQDVSTWHGVTVNAEGHVIGLNLENNNVNGTIPASIGNLSKLQTLILKNNFVSGSLPSEIVTLANLNVLDLYFNNITGAIPTSIGSMGNLYTLILSYNHFSGQIPSTVGTLSNLRQLEIDGNQLTGSIPVSIGNLINLEILNLANNQISGEIIAELGNLGSLQTMNLVGNQLSGSIPNVIGNLDNLVGFFVSSNQLSGSIPSSIGNLDNLQMLNLDFNAFTGELPISIGGMEAAISIDVQGNQLTGAIPPSIGNLQNLMIFSASGNKFTSLPHEVTNATSLMYLLLSNNQLIDPLPPGMGAMPNLGIAMVNGNRLTFSDLIQTTQSFAGFLAYQVQDSVDTKKIYKVEIGSQINLATTIDQTTSPASQYTWYKYPSSTVVGTGPTLTIANFQSSNSGSYYYKITNSTAPMLTLVSKFQKLEIATSAAIIYVKKGAPQNGDGRSWNTAFPELRQAIDEAKTIYTQTQIWVAHGEYQPSVGLDRTASFEIPENTFLYGGFVGNETSLDARNWKTNRTVLSGDLGAMFDTSDNSYHVVFAKNVGENSGIDGFIITEGNANGNSNAHNDAGGGMLILANTDATSPKINNCEFVENTATQYGGGLANISYGASIATIVTNSFFNGNTSSIGGGVANIRITDQNAPSFLNCSFSTNHANQIGGALANINTTTSIINSSFAKNNALINGGAIYNNTSTSVIQNSILWKNFNGTSEMEAVYNQIFNQNSIPVVKHNIIQGGYGSEADQNTTSDPLFLREPSFEGKFPRTSIIPVTTTELKYEKQLTISGPMLTGAWPYYTFMDHQYNRMYRIGYGLQVLDFGNLNNNKPTSTIYNQIWFGKTQRLEQSIHSESNKIYFSSDAYGSGIFSVHRLNGGMIGNDPLVGEPVPVYNWVRATDLVVDDTNNLLYAPIFYLGSGNAQVTFQGLLEWNLETQTKRWINTTSSPVSIPQVPILDTNEYWGIYRIYLDEIENTLYFSTAAGVWWWNRGSNATGVINTAGGISLSSGSPNLPSNITTGMFMDHVENKFYIGTHAGLFVWNRNDNTSRVYNTENSNLMHNLINMIDKNDEKNLIYISCEDGGLLIINTLTGEETLVSEDAGNQIYPQFMDNSAASAHYDEIDKKLYVSADHWSGGTWIVDYAHLISDYGDLSLQINSPALDLGDESVLSASISSDINGLPRRIDYPTIFGSRSLDAGAYERFYELLTASPCGSIFCNEMGVGIGTEILANGYAISVSGKVITEGVRVMAQTSWPDYVFKSEFKLMPLADLKKFIKTYRHLPDVPSAENVKQTGIDAGEMSIILLKKTEELTLHLIQLNDRLKKAEDARNYKVK